MRKKCLVTLALAALLGVAIASAKSYDITLYNRSQFGSATLQPGDYRVKVEGSKVVVIDSSGKDAAEANARIETANKKFDRTEITVSLAGGAHKIMEIDLGGSKTRLVIE